MTSIHNGSHEQCIPFQHPSINEEDESDGCASCTCKIVMIFISAFIAANTPIALLLLSYSQISPVAPTIIKFLAMPTIQYTGYAIFAMSASFAMLLSRFRIGDDVCTRLGWSYIILYGAIGISLLFAAHSVSVLFSLILLNPLFLSICLRAVSVKDKLWWRLAATVLLCSSVLYLLIWLSWLFVRLPNLEKITDWTSEFREMVKSKDISWKDAFVSWALPPAISVELSCISVLCWTRTSRLDVKAEHDDPELAQVVVQVKQILLALFSVIIILWIGASVDATGANEMGQKREHFGDELMRIGFFAFLLIFGWTVFILGLERVQLAFGRSKVAKQFKDFMDSDMVRGLAVLSFSPVFALLLVVPYFSKKKMVMNLKTWNWTAILVKAQWWAAAYMCFNVGFAKATVVFLAWINTTLSNWPIGAVSSIIFLLGYFLFLLPPTPGVPVYMVTGIVVVSSALKNGWHFWTATTLSVFVGFAIKMAFAATAQKCIGEPLAHYVAIRRAVGVTSVEMRAVEMILRTPSLTPGKVAVLIGGPDWPVAVLCGLLKLPLFPILLGICPILFQSVIPCVLSGALLVSKDDEIEALGSTALAVAGLLQGVAAIIAGYYMQEAIEEYYEELSESRPQDKEVEEYAAAVAQAEKAYDEATSWQVLPRGIQVLLISGLMLAEASIAVLSGPWKSMFGQGCFKAFSLVGSIDTDLDGNVWSIVLPAGWIGLGIYGLSLLCFVLFYLWARKFNDLDTSDMRP